MEVTKFVVYDGSTFVSFNLSIMFTALDRTQTCALICLLYRLGRGCFLCYSNPGFVSW